MAPPSPTVGLVASAPKRNPSPERQALEAGGAQDLAPRDQKGGTYEPGAPIKFYDEEVKRMHTALGKRADEERRAARRALRSRSSVPRSGVTISGFFARVVIFYVLIAYFIVCPTDTLRERAVCRGLDSFGAKLHALEPTVKPYYRTTQKKLDPYVEEVKRYSQPYVDRVKPYYSRAEKVVGPYAEKAAKTYRQLVYPKLVSGVRYSQAMTRPYVAKATQQYTKTLAPSVDWYSKSLRQWYAVKVEPTLTQLSSTSREYGQAVYDTVSPIYTRGVPLAQHHYRTHLVPFSRQSWSISRSTYLSHIHPRALTLGGHVQRLYQTRVLPALQRFWSVFIAPQLDKIRERIFEYKAKKARAEALERVEKVSEDIAKDHGEDDFEDFIKELRDDTFVGEPESPPSPADNPPAYSADTPPPASPEELAAARVEKRNALETLQSAYEREIAALGQTEHRLLVDRLIEIRQHALDDIPTRFEALLERLDEEGDKMVGKLGKYFAKVAGDEKVEVEEKVKESEFLSEKARLKVKKMSEDVKHELEAYKLDLEAKEDKAVKQAQESVSALVSKAQEELGFGWTWFDGVTHKDWQRFHGLRKAEENLHASFAGLQSGSIKDQFLASLDPHSLLAKYASQPDSLVSAFERILSKITLKGQKELKGEWTGVVDEAQKAYDAVGGKMAALVDNIKVSSCSKRGSQPSGRGGEFKEMRKAWREKKKAEAAAAARARAVNPPNPSSLPTTMDPLGGPNGITPVLALSSDRPRPSTSAGEYHYTMAAPFVAPLVSPVVGGSGFHHPGAAAFPHPHAPNGFVDHHATHTAPWSTPYPLHGQPSATHDPYTSSGVRPVTAPSYFLPPAFAQPLPTSSNPSLSSPQSYASPTFAIPNSQSSPRYNHPPQDRRFSHPGPTHPSPLQHQYHSDSDVKMPQPVLGYSHSSLLGGSQGSNGSGGVSALGLGTGAGGSAKLVLNGSHGGVEDGFASIREEHEGEENKPATMMGE
ncbi:hypothetical protein JCM1841_003517 [Sporobolomyces salmonicolor]